MFSRRKCEKQLIGFLTSIYRERISQTVCSFALQILRQELLHCIPRKTRYARRLLRCTPCFRDGSDSVKLRPNKCLPLCPDNRTSLTAIGTSGQGHCGHRGEVPLAPAAC